MPTAPKPARHEAAESIRQSNPEVIRRMNEFTNATFRTRGGRMGSGMGLLLEGLWGYHMSAVLAPHKIDISWIAEDQYNDYACTYLDEDWNPATKAGELLCIEAKSMNLGADEPKGHFAELATNIGPEDLLLVLVWEWLPVQDSRQQVWPSVVEAFLGRALSLARLRDSLHIARGGTFVDRLACPDECVPELCQHHGEPLNARGSRERLQGPESREPKGSSIGANFGGLKRMIGVGTQVARAKRTEICASDEVAGQFVDFMQRVTRR